MEGRRLGGKRCVFQPILRSVVCNGEIEARRRANGFLVAEPRRFAIASELRALLQKGFRVHFCVCLHVDPIHSKPDYP